MLRQKTIKEINQQVQQKISDLQAYLCAEMLECEGQVAAYKMHLELERARNRDLIRNNRNLKIKVRELEELMRDLQTEGVSD